MAKQLRHYQAAAIEQVRAQLDANPILVLPTGGGKTFTAAALVQQLGRETLWLAHRKELVDQAARQLRGLGLATQLIMSGRRAYDDYFFFSGPTVHVASVDTLAGRELPRVGLVVSDECHHDTSDRRRGILKHYQDAGVPTLGLTATPFRLDGKGLFGAGYGAIVVGATTADLVEAGTLHAPRVYAGRSPELRGVGISAGDYNKAALAKRVNQYQLIENIVETWMKKAPGLKTICFAVNIEHSQSIVRLLRRKGVAAEHLDGSSKDRDAILARLASGQTQVVSNCMVLTEGFDLPALECAILARPTASLCLHLQMVGRIMRACAGKAGALVLDHAGNHHVHGLVTRRLEYSLDGKVAGESDPLGLRRCGGCFLLYPPSLPSCPECGWVPQVRKPAGRTLGAENGEGGEELTELVEDYAYRAEYWRLIEAQREALGFQPGWALWRYKERFGTWPDVVAGELVNPEQASLETRREAYAGFARTAREKGYKPGWAKVRFKNLFGDWPRAVEMVEPMAPRPAAPALPPPPLRRPERMVG